MVIVRIWSDDETRFGQVARKSFQSNYNVAGTCPNTVCVFQASSAGVFNICSLAPSVIRTRKKVVLHVGRFRTDDDRKSVLIVGALYCIYFSFFKDDFQHPNVCVSLDEIRINFIRYEPLTLCLRHEFVSSSDVRENEV